MKPTSLILAAANLVVSVTFATSWATSNVKLDEYQVIYCPFDIKSASLTPDASAIDVTYTTSTSPKTFRGIDKSACFVQFRIGFIDQAANDRGIHLASIEYTGSGKVTESKAV